MYSPISSSIQTLFRVYLSLLFLFALPLAQAALKEVKRVSLNGVDYVTCEYRNTTKKPITIQLRVHNNLFYDTAKKRYYTKPLTFPPFTLKPGDVREGLVFTVTRGERVQDEEVGNKPPQGEPLRDTEPGLSRKPTQAPAGAANPQGKTDRETDGLKPMIGSWNVTRSLYKYESQMQISLRIGPTGNGSWTSKQVFQNGDVSNTIWDAQVTTDAPGQWKLLISNGKNVGGRGRSGRDFSMTIRSSGGVFQGTSPRNAWILSR